MEEIIKILIKIFIEDPFSIIKNFIKAMRTVLLILISSHFYEKYIYDFTILTDAKLIFDFFMNGEFLKPLFIFILTILLFDKLLNILIERIFGKIFIDKQIKIATEITTYIKEKKENSMELQEFIQSTQNKFINKSITILSKIIVINKNEINTQEIMANTTQIDIEKFNVFSLIIVQLNIFLFLISGNHISIIIISLFSIIIIQILKSLFHFSKIYYNGILNEPNRTK